MQLVALSNLGKEASSLSSNGVNRHLVSVVLCCVQDLHEGEVKRSSENGDNNQTIKHTLKIARTLRQ